MTTVNVIPYLKFPTKVRSFIKDYFSDPWIRNSGLHEKLEELHIYQEERPSNVPKSAKMELIPPFKIACYEDIIEWDGVVHEITHFSQWLLNRGSYNQHDAMLKTASFSDYMKDEYEIEAQNAQRACKEHLEKVFEVKLSWREPTPREEETEETVEVYKIIEEHPEEFNEYVNNYVANHLQYGEETDEEWIADNARDYLLCLSPDALKEELGLSKHAWQEAPVTGRWHCIDCGTDVTSEKEPPLMKWKDGHVCRFQPTPKDYRESPEEKQKFDEWSNQSIERSKLSWQLDITDEAYLPEKYPEGSTPRMQNTDSIRSNILSYLLSKGPSHFMDILHIAHPGGNWEKKSTYYALKYLRQTGLVEKISYGVYDLTPRGKEFAKKRFDSMNTASKLSWQEPKRSLEAAGIFNGDKFICDSDGKTYELLDSDDEDAYFDINNGEVPFEDQIPIEDIIEWVHSGYFTKVSSRTAAEDFSEYKGINKQMYQDRSRRMDGNGAQIFWSSQSAQDKRFEALLDIGTLTDKTILDVGCGHADFLDFIEKKGIKIDKYVGVDIVPEIVEKARVLHPGINIEVRDIQEDPIQEDSFDFVFGSGIFALQNKNWEAYVVNMLKDMLNIAIEGVSVNFLKGQSRYNNLRYNDPQKTLELIKKHVSDKAVLKDNYLEDDFSIFIYK